MADQPDYINGQPAPLRNTGKSMHDLVRRDMATLRSPTNPIQDSQVMLVCERLEQRKEYGLKKYGTILQAHNGRDPLQDAIEEAIDLAVYLRQCVEEQKNILDTVIAKVNKELLEMAYKASLHTLIYLETVNTGRKQ